MNRRELLAGMGAMGAGVIGTLGSAGLGGLPLGWAADGDKPKRRILFFSRSQGFQHDSVNLAKGGMPLDKEGKVKRKGEPGKLSHADGVLKELGAAHGFEVDCTKDGGVFTPDNIAKYDAFFFYTTGDLTAAKSADNTPPMTPEGKAALLEAVKNGKGFLGSHCASDTFHTNVDRFVNAGPDKVDPYIAMLGGEFIKHGRQQKAKMVVLDKKFPGFEKLSDFEMMEEWYSLKDFAPDLHVLLLQETKGMQDFDYDRPPYPATWARMHGKGRVFYTSMGHREDVWVNPLFQDVLLGAISWAVGNVEVDVKPNISQVAPDALVLPKKPEPKKAEPKKADEKK
jgi:type 1 glutamine amidotransferase